MRRFDDRDRERERREKEAAEYKRRRNEQRMEYQHRDKSPHRREYYGRPPPRHAYTESNPYGTGPSRFGERPQPPPPGRRHSGQNAPTSPKASYPKWSSRPPYKEERRPGHKEDTEYKMRRVSSGEWDRRGPPPPPHDERRKYSGRPPPQGPPPPPVGASSSGGGGPKNMWGDRPQSRERDNYDWRAEGVGPPGRGGGGDWDHWDRRDRPHRERERERLLPYSREESYRQGPPMRDDRYGNAPVLPPSRSMPGSRRESHVDRYPPSMHHQQQASTSSYHPQHHTHGNGPPQRSVSNEFHYDTKGGRNRSRSREKSLPPSSTRPASPKVEEDLFPHRVRQFLPQVERERAQSPLASSPSPRHNRSPKASILGYHEKEVRYDSDSSTRSSKGRIEEVIKASHVPEEGPEMLPEKPIVDVRAPDVSRLEAETPITKPEPEAEVSGKPELEKEVIEKPTDKEVDTTMNEVLPVVDVGKTAEQVAEPVKTPAEALEPAIPVPAEAVESATVAVGVEAPVEDLEPAKVTAKVIEPAKIPVGVSHESPKAAETITPIADKVEEKQEPVAHDNQTSVPITTDVKEGTELVADEREQITVEVQQKESSIAEKEPAAGSEDIVEETLSMTKSPGPTEPQKMPEIERRSIEQEKQPEIEAMEVDKKDDKILPPSEPEQLPVDNESDIPMDEFNDDEETDIEEEKASPAEKSEASLEIKEEVLPEQFPLNRVEQAFYLLSRSAKEELRSNLRYLNKNPDLHKTVRENKDWFDKGAMKSKLKEYVFAREGDLIREARRLRKEYLTNKSEWLLFCQQSDRELDDQRRYVLEQLQQQDKQSVPNGEPKPESRRSAPHTPAIPQSGFSKDDASHERSSRRSRVHGDMVRSEAEFMEILATLERENAMDPSVRAKLTSAVVPDMIMDPIEREKFRFTDTNNAVADKSIPYQRLFTDAVDNFTPEEHERFCTYFATYPKQFGKIAQLMGGLRTYNDCVLHYYNTKKDVDYKALVLSNRRRSQRRRKRTTKSGKVVGEGILPQETPIPNTPLPKETEEGEKTSESALPTSTTINEENPFDTLASIAAAAAAENEAAAAAAAAAATTPKKRSGPTEYDVEKRKSEEAVEGTTRKRSRTGAKSRAKKERQKSDDAVVPPVPQVPQAPPAPPVAERPEVPVAVAPPPPVPVPTATAHKVSSYWSLAEIGVFDRLVRQFGTRFEEYTPHIKTKSLIMIKNFFNKHIEDRGYGALAQETDARLREISPTQFISREVRPERSPLGAEYVVPPNAQGPPAGYFPPRSGEPIASSPPVVSIQQTVYKREPTPPIYSRGDSRQTSPLSASIHQPVLPSISKLADIAVASPPAPPLARFDYSQAPRPVIRPQRSSAISSILSGDTGELKREPGERNILPPLRHQTPPPPPGQQLPTPGYGPTLGSFSTPPVAGRPAVYSSGYPQPPPSHSSPAYAHQQQQSGGQQPPAQYQSPQPMQQNPLLSRGTSPHYSYGYSEFQSRESNERGGTRSQYPPR